MRARLLALLMLVTPLAVAGTAGQEAGAVGTLHVQVLSNRADLISAGDALVAVRLPRGVRASSVMVRAGSRDVTRFFRLRPNGRFEGLVTGLPLGRTVLHATAPGYSGQMTVVNHPNGGPVFSGPQVRFYQCQTSAMDKKCNQPASYRLLYRSTDPTKAGLQHYDRKNPPSDVATTTTDRGVTVPFIVRQESGYQDRDRYTILTLFRPGKPWRAWAPQKQWNHKLLITHGGSCGATHAPGTPPLSDYSGTVPEGVPAYENTYELALGRGFAVLSTALDNTGHNCNPVIEAESLVMAKERLVERYGELRYTIGYGCSGGSIAEQTVANAYPGVYQGLVTQCTYPDALSTASQFGDFHLLRLYFEDPSRWAPGVLWSPTQFADVEGHLAHVDAVAADEAFLKAAIDPRNACPGTKPTVPGDRSTIYDAQTNPAGVRCSVPEMMKNPLGPRPKSVWSAAEKQAGFGFAGLPVGNVGVQYGLTAMQKGLITPAQFVDLNAKVGGLDIDGGPTAERLHADLAGLRNAFRTGLVNEFQHLGSVAIINLGGPDPGAAHDYSHAFWAEARLQRSQGHTKNRVMWFGETPIIGDPTWSKEAFLEVDQWLNRVERDKREVSLAQKINQDRPDEVTDRCFNVTGLEAVPGPDGPVCQMPELQTHLGTPRTVAGGDEANDHNQCQLEPLVRDAYLPTTFTDDQWAQLQAVFSTGVCDWSKPGVGQSIANETWLHYGNARTPVYGGASLPGRPVGTMVGWTSPAFRAQLNQ